MDLLDLMATLSVNTSDFQSGMNSAQQQATNASSAINNALNSINASKAFQAISEAANEAADSMMNTFVSATQTITQYVSGIVQQSKALFGEYQQLVGGVETLFGSDYQTVLQNADDAFINMGISANNYMETATSFAASLVESLDGNTKQAATSVDLALQDMSDNANKMGTDMSSIQRAYQGFAKQNYTINLMSAA